MKNFKVGQNVICIDDSKAKCKSDRKYIKQKLKKGNEYTVTKVFNEQDIQVDNGNYGWEKSRFVLAVTAKNEK